MVVVVGEDGFEKLVRDLNSEGCEALKLRDQIAVEEVEKRQAIFANYRSYALLLVVNSIDGNIQKLIELLKTFSEDILTQIEQAEDEEDGLSAGFYTFEGFKIDSKTKK